MTSGIGRRQAGVMFALLPALALGWPMGAAARASGPRPPSGALKLTRTLTRGLGDGKAIVVTRSWTISVAPAEAGFLVTGTQVSAEVAAPPVLSKHERSREGGGLFPVRLDPGDPRRRSGSADATLVRELTDRRGALRSCERSVVTRLAGSERTASERWEATYAT